MRKTTRKAAVLVLLLGSMLCQAQETPETKQALVTARMQLLKTSPSYNPEAAITSLKQLAAQGSAEAMNALGMVYSKGLGVPANETEGTQWFTKAAEAGYAKGWFNMGELLKDNEPAKAVGYFEKAATAGYPVAFAAWGRMVYEAKGVPQDFALAVNLFKQGAEKGNAYCHYMLGYLYYKGLGCTQNYSQAVQQFEIAAQKNQDWGMYMLGLCYRNGYGVAIDTQKAKYWLNKAAALGVKPSQKELEDSQAENANPKQLKTVSKPIDEVISLTETETPATFKKVKQAPITQTISGSYTGNLLTYDWSGQNIISSTPLEINLQQDGKQLSGKWTENTGNTMDFNAQIQENAIVFQDSKMVREEHYNKEKPVNYEFKEARLQILQTDESLFLVGNLQLYNPGQKEIEKPMYLILEKKQEKTVTEASKILSKVVVYPNPFAGSFELSFELTQTTDVTASIHSLTGNLYYTTQWNALEQGSQKRMISLDAPTGYYILRLSYGEQVKTAILIKN